jgi:hypothetical protein
MQGEALKEFSDCKTLAVKEEGDTLHVCQACDKDVAKEDKCHHCSFLNNILLEINMVDQWALVLVANKVSIILDYGQSSSIPIPIPSSTSKFIIIAAFFVLQALNKIRKIIWGESHHLVHLCPSNRIDFTEYVKRVKDVVDAGDFFHCRRQGMFDAMPACWKNLTRCSGMGNLLVRISFVDISMMVT